MSSIEIPLPKIESKDSIVPNESEKVTVYCEPINYDDLRFKSIVDDSLRSYGSLEFPKIPVVGLSDSLRVECKAYWKRIYEKEVEGPIKDNITVTSKENTSTSNSTITTNTDSSTISGEVGIEIKAISASISASSTSSTSNTSSTLTKIGTEKTTTNEYSVEAKEGETVIVTCWQLVYESSIIDDENKFYTWQGQANTNTEDGVVANVYNLINAVYTYNSDATRISQSRF